MTQALTVILKPGYAPVEQYADDPSMRQGPWTDIYALGAVVYLAVTGHTPTASVGRIVSDSLAPLSEVAAGRYSVQFLNAIDLALAVKPEDRPQNVEELSSLLELPSSDRNQRQHSAPHEQAAIFTIGAEDRSTSAPKRRLTFYIAAFMTLVAASGAGFFLLRKETANVTPGQTSAPGSSVPATPALVDKKQFDPLKALDEIFQRRDPNHAVTVSTEKAQTRIGKDPLRFRIRSARTGYVYLLMVGTNRSDFFLLFPNAVDKRNRIKAGEQLDLPRSEWKMIAEGPPGTDHFVVIVSDQPRDFTVAGLEPIDPFAEFPPQRAARLHHAYTGSTPLFAGKATCTDATPDCPGSYGAAVFSIEEIQGT